MKRIFNFLIYFSCMFVIVNGSAQAIESEFGLSYEQYQMPNHIPALGVLGVHGLMHFTRYFYSGLVGYEAVSGNRGGYFGLGVDVGLQYPLYPLLWADTGVRVGGAGGQNSPVGGGLFLQPYVGLKYHLPKYRIGLEYSYIDFPSGQITSHQIGFGISFPLRSSKNNHYQKNYVAIMARNSMPSSNTKNTAGNSDTSHFQSLGIEVGHYLTKQFFAFGNFVGAFHGRLNGYAQSLLGLGYEYPLTKSKKLHLIGKLGAGSAGGGAVNTGGGFIVEPNIGFEYRFVKSMGLEMNIGYVNAIDGSFSASEINILLKYFFNKNNNIHHDLKNWRIRILNQTYLKPRINSGEINPTMQLLGVDFDYLMNHYCYATGQAAFAYSGKQTGGYFSGMLGVGAESMSISDRFPFSIFAEMLVGTAGGAGLDISSGALYEPVVGVNYSLTQALGLQLSTGRLMAMGGGFNSTTINAGITYLFS